MSKQPDDFDDPLDLTLLLGKQTRLTATKAELAWSAVGLVIVLLIAWIS